MLRKYLMGLLALFCSVVALAQSKPQVIEGIKFTMNDFTSALNGLCMDGADVSGEIKSIADNFKGEYFIFNGKKMDSFGHWLEMYYGLCIQGKVVEHTLQIKEASFENVDADEDDDKRYRIRYILDRRIDGKPVIPQEVSFVLTWQNKDQYLKIVEVRGDWGLDVLDIAKVGDKHWLYLLGEWGFGMEILLIIIGIAIPFLLIFLLMVKFEASDNVFAIVLSILTLFSLVFPSYILDDLDSMLRPKDTRKLLSTYKIHMNYDSVQIAWVKKDNLIGMVDYKGNLILDYQFEDVGRFSDGLAWVWLKKRGGYVNTDGDVVVPPIYTYVHVFRDGIALVGNEKGYFIINTEALVSGEKNLRKCLTL